MNEIKIAEMIEKHMRKNNWTMRELGEKLNKSESTVSLWISGKAQPRMGVVQEMALLFDVPTDELVFGKDIQNNDMIPSNISSLEDATRLIIDNPSVAYFGGYDLDKMTDDEKIEFANQIADSIKFFAKRYKK